MTSRKKFWVAAMVGLALVVATLAVLVVRGTEANAIGGRFELVDDHGAPVTEADFSGKPSLFYFGYTFCPEICPTTLTDLQRWMQKLGPDADKLNYAFITIDPERDTVRLMHDYVGSFDPRLRGLTGTPQQITAAAKAFRVYFRKIPNPHGGYEMDHSAFIYLLDARGKFLDVINYGESDQTALIKIRALINNSH